MYGTGFTMGCLARVGASDGMWVPGIEVGSDKELMDVGRMAKIGRGE